MTFQYEHFAKAVLEYSEKHEIRMRGQLLKVEKATSPRDVYWENLAFHKKRRELRQYRAFFMTVCGLLMVFLIGMGIQYYMDNWLANQDDAAAAAANSPTNSSHFFSTKHHSET